MTPLIIFLLLSLVVAVAGTFLTETADRLADTTGLGEALMGGVLLGACTSLSGTVTSVTSAYHGHSDLAISNALGGIALQTFFLVIADFCYRRSNLEHAAASSTNIMQGVLLIFLLSIPLTYVALGDFTWGTIHPITLLLLFFYIGGLYFVHEEKEDNMWYPRKTELTVSDVPHEKKNAKKASRLWIRFGLLSLSLGLCGYFLEKYGLKVSEKFGLSQLLLGSLFTSLATSLPELVTTIVAVRRKAITLAVGGIIGGNTFDVLFLAFSDVAYSEGSLYHQLTPQHLGLITLNILMTSTLTFGLIRREKSGLGNVGFETLCMGTIFIVGYFFILSS